MRLHGVQLAASRARRERPARRVGVAVVVGGIAVAGVGFRPASADVTVVSSTATDYGHVTGDTGPDIHGNTTQAVGTGSAGVPGPYSAPAATAAIDYGSGNSSATVALDAYALTYTASTLTAAGGYTTTQNEVGGGPGTPYVDGPYATVAGTVNFTVDRPTYYTVSGTLPADYDQDGSFGLYNGSTLIYYDPHLDSTDPNQTNILRPGNTYTLQVSYKSTAYAPDDGQHWNFAVSTTALTAGTSAPAQTSTAGVYGGQASTASVNAQFTGGPNGTLAVTNDRYISAEGLTSANSPLGERAGPLTFALPNTTDATEGWALSYTGDPVAGPITLTFTYDPALLGPGVTADQLAIYHYTAGQWVLPAGEVVDPADDTITVEVDSLSPFALGITSTPEPGSLLLLSTGTLGLLGRRRGRARA